MKRAIYAITLKDQMPFKKYIIIHLIEFQAEWQAVGIQELWKTIE
jgi:hypothetical protein